MRVTHAVLSGVVTLPKIFGTVESSMAVRISFASVSIGAASYLVRGLILCNHFAIISTCQNPLGACVRGREYTTTLRSGGRVHIGWTVGWAHIQIWG